MWLLDSLELFFGDFSNLEREWGGSIFCFLILAPREKMPTIYGEFNNDLYYMIPKHYRKCLLYREKHVLST